MELQRLQARQELCGWLPLGLFQEPSADWRYQRSEVIFTIQHLPIVLRRFVKITSIGQIEPDVGIYLSRPKGRPVGAPVTF